nr:hypothetical protein CFP56_79326 [Quercus suber]
MPNEAGSAATAAARWSSIAVARSSIVVVGWGWEAKGHWLGVRGVGSVVEEEREGRRKEGGQKREGGQIGGGLRWQAGSAASWIGRELDWRQVGLTVTAGWVRRL